MAEDPWAAAGFKPVAAPPRTAPKPSPVRVRRDLEETNLRETAQSANMSQAVAGANLAQAPIDRARAATALEVERATIGDEISGNQAKSQKAQLEALEARLRSETPGGFATQDERQTAFNYKRLLNSERRVLAALKKDPSADAAPVLPELAERLPMVGDMVANAITDPERRIVSANRLDMLDAALYLATGAAYNKEQLRNLSRAYFPQVGDDAAARADKAGKLNELVANAKDRAAMGLVAPGRKEAPVARGAPPGGRPKTPGVTINSIRQVK